MNARVEQLVADAHAVVREAIEQTLADNRRVAGIVVLYSGGNDSTTVAHMFRDVATHAAHANTGIGIEQTRQFVRDTCAAWGLPLIEKHPEPGGTYRDLVLGRCRARTGPRKGTVVWQGGFPGPAAHWLMYQRLKERALEQVRRELITNPWRERVLFIAGRRAEESDRRKHLAAVQPIERRGSTVWVSPIVGWTKLDLNAYRDAHPDVPRNEVSDALHMSGECLCGAFAHEGELDEIGFFYPEVAAEIRALGEEMRAAGIPEERCTWGWGATKDKPSRTGPMCSSCSSRFIPAEVAA